MPRPHSLVGVAMCTIFCMAAGARADELWRQNPAASPGGYSSQDARNPGGLGWFSEVADNFDAAAGTQVSEVVFWGGYVRPPGQEGHVTGFTVRFYDGAGGAPGMRLFERDVLDTTETLFQVVSGFGEYEYHSLLNPPFSASAAGRHWVSVVAILARGGSADEPQWGWAQSVNQTLPHAQQWFFSPGNFVEQSTDVSFMLNGSVQMGVRGDLNCDGLLNNFDIDPFVLAQVDAAAYAILYPNCDAMRGDINGDGLLNNFDIDPFVACLVNGACP